VVTMSPVRHLPAQVLALFASVLFLPGSAVFAATLGDMDILSGPGENLRAEVPIFEVDPETAQTLVASVADEALSKAAELTQTESLPLISSELSQRGDGSWYLTLVSSEVMPNEYNEIILELTWQNGSYLREYVLNFDGFTTSAQSSQDISQTSSVAIDSQEKIPRVQVAKGDSLLSIARAVEFSSDSSIGNDRNNAALQPGTVQIMFAIYNNNPAAFGGSPDKLRAGTTLDIPTLAEITAIDIEQARALFSAESSVSTSSVENTTSNFVSEVSPSATTINAGPAATDGLQVRDASIPLYETVSPVADERELAVNQAVVVETRQVLDQIESDMQLTDQRVADLDESVGSINTRLVSIEDSVIALDSVVEQTSERVGNVGLQLDSLRVANEDLKSTIVLESADAAIDKTVLSAKWSERIDSLFTGSEYKRSILLLCLALVLSFVLVARQILARRKESVITERSDDMSASDMSAPGVSASAKAISNATKTANTTTSMNPNHRMKAIADTNQPNEDQQLEENSEHLSAVAWFSEHLQSERISDDALAEALKGLPNRQDLRLRLMQRYAQQKNITQFAQLGQEMFRMTRGRNSEWPEVIQLALALELEMQVVQGKTASKAKSVRLAEHLDLTLDRTAV